MPNPQRKSIIILIKAAWSYITQTHFFKIATSNPVSNALAITFAILALAGVTATPFGPAIVGVLSAVAFTSIAIKVIVSTIQARQLRHLEKENKLLVKNRDAKNAQDRLLEDNTKLNLLENQLFNPETTRAGKKSVNTRLVKNASKSEIIAKSVGRAFLKQGLDIALAVANSIATAGIGLAIKIANIIAVFFSFGLDARATANLEVVNYNLRQQIDSERGKKDTPGYNNIQDLMAQVRKQRIQTMALKELIYDKDYNSWNDDKIQKKFTEKKDEICATEKEIIASRNILIRGARALGGVIKDAASGQSPYSRVNNPRGIVIEKPDDGKKPSKNKPDPRKIAAKVTPPEIKPTSDNTTPRENLRLANKKVGPCK